MPVEVILPKVDMDMETGRVALWHVAEGDSVEKGAPLFDLETDKAAMEVESPASGVLRHVRLEAGDSAPIGTVIGWIYAADEEDAPPPDAASAEPSASEAPAPEKDAAPDAGPSPTAAPPPLDTNRPRATPAARKAAAAAGMALEDIAGSGPNGRVQRADVDAYAPSDSAPIGWTPEEGPLSLIRSGASESAATPLFMLHGFAGDRYAFAALTPKLDPSRAMLTLELPSHGLSPRRAIRNFDALAADIIDAFDASHTERTHLLGHSLGGALAIALAHARPQAIASLTLIAPAGLGPELDGAAIQGLARASRAASLGPWLRRLTADPGLLDDDFIRAAMAARENPALRAAQSAMADALFPDGVQSFDLRGALREISAPTLLLWGRSDAIAPWRHALEAPGSVALHLFDAVGHLPHFEAADAIAPLIDRHIAHA